MKKIFFIAVAVVIAMMLLLVGYGTFLNYTDGRISAAGFGGAGNCRRQADFGAGGAGIYQQRGFARAFSFGNLRAAQADGSCTL